MKFIFILVIIITTGCLPQNLDALPNNYPDNYPEEEINSNPPELRKNISQKIVRKTDVIDGPPANPRRTTFVEATPVAEPFSRYGNPTQYTMNGELYEVMKSAIGYRAHGLASWYGTKFHSLRTSSGDPYDLYGMTAAHKTLPLPTYVKVKNMNNGLEIIVKVNDRGPFYEDRIIDLSYAAAKKLGFLAHGTAPVEIEALTPGGMDSKPVHYYLQAGAFAKQQQAKKFLEDISKWTSAPLFIEQHEQFYVVKAGPLDDKESTINLKTKLAHHGIHDVFSMLQ